MSNMHARPVAIITGAGSGIGREAAIQLAGRGYALTLAGRTLGRLQETARLTGLPIAEVFCLVADVGDQAQAVGIVDATVQRFGRLDVLINNAGYAPPAPIEGKTPEKIRAIFDINAVGPATMIARAWPIFKAQAPRAGARHVVVNVSSYATVDPFPTLFAYAAAKAGVNLMARSVANEGRLYKTFGFAVAPGAVETDMLRAIVDRDTLPERMTLKPADVARVIVECVAGTRDAQNGQVIYLPSPVS